MLIFKAVRWKNFLSTGNIFTEIKLNETGNALIIGENGAGKSTILDAITFALFGKPFRKINKPGLVNSVNQKASIVEIDFDTNGKEYKIIRGIKPNVFEIYCDGIMLNQDSASKDYQEHLEKFILKMNYKSFTQIVILGSASFTPFMQLSPADRRTVIEDLLDIQIFSTMNVIARQKMLANKDSMERNRLETAGKEEKKSFIERQLSNLRTNNEEKLIELEAQFKQYKDETEKLDSDIVEMKAERENLLDGLNDKLTSLTEKHTKLLNFRAKIDANKHRHEKDNNFYHDNNNCPTCKQTIEEQFKLSIITDNQTKITDLQTGLDKIENEISNVVDELQRAQSLNAKAQDYKTEIINKQSKSKHNVSLMDLLEESINKIKHSDNMVIDNERELMVVDIDLNALATDKNELLDERQYIETAINLLKDGGIKTKIIKQYLPVINKLINKYLSQMGFFVNFNINESFEETIKSRYRDEFQYANFSEGEKMRIDLALLFTWRSIAKMRNSVNTNLLILDEVLDGSLDNNGTDEFLKIMWTMIGDTNTFVISHKQDQLIDKFQKVIRFEKHKNFSRLSA